MSKRHADSTPDKKAPKRRKFSADEVLVEAARNGDTTAVLEGLEKLRPDTDSKTVSFDAVHEACRGNHDECLALLLPYVETTQMGFGMLLSECIHADHTACTEVLLRHWKSVCSNVAFVPHGHMDGCEGQTSHPCPAMWEDPAVCQVLIDAGAGIEVKDERGRSPLLKMSSLSGALAVVKMLVEAGAEVCTTDNKGNTCLMLAAYFGRTETVRYLVGLPQVDVNKESSNWDVCEGKYPIALHSAVHGGHLDVVQVLIDAGAYIETKSQWGRTPLHVASALGELDIVKMLVEAGASVRATDNLDDTCLIVASTSEHTETVRYLAGLEEVDVNYNNGRRSALLTALRRQRTDVVKVLVDAGADIEVEDERGYSLLEKASMCGDLLRVKMLVEAGAVADAGCLKLAVIKKHTETVRYLAALPQVDVNEMRDGCSVVFHAISFWGSDPDFMQVLIDAGADIEVKDEMGRSPLHYASGVRELGIVKLLIKAGAKVCATDNTGGTCLHIVSAKGRTETVRYLVGLKDVDVNIADDKGYTALHSAVDKGHVDVVQVLIDAGADIDAKNNMGRSPLFWAWKRGKLDIVKVLVKAGADVCVTDNKGDTCLSLTAANGRTETVRYLVGLPEVDVNIADEKDFTALHSAVDEGHVDVVQVLIAAGADIEAKDEMGRTPLHVASENGNMAIVKMLVKAGADVRVAQNEGDTYIDIASAKGHTDTVRYLMNLPEVDVKQTDKLGNTALEAALEQGNAMKEEMKALQEMMKSVMDQQKEMLEAQKGVLGPTQQTAPVSEQPEQGGMAELRAECAEMRETVRQCSEHIVKMAEESKRLAEEMKEEIESLKKAQRKDEGKGL